MSLHRPDPSERGFTLVEVLLATALLAVIAAMVFGSLQLSTMAIDGARRAAAREEIVRSTLRIMTEELTAGTSSSVGPWIGVSATQEGQPSDTVAFLTLGQFRGAFSSQETEMVRIVYTKESDRLLRLVRRNMYGLNDESVDQLELAKNVRGFNVRYYDAKSNVWVDDWDGRAHNAPGAILIELTVMQENEELRTYRQWVSVGVK